MSFECINAVVQQTWFIDAGINTASWPSTVIVCIPWTPWRACNPWAPCITHGLYMPPCCYINLRLIRILWLKISWKPIDNNHLHKLWMNRMDRNQLRLSLGESDRLRFNWSTVCGRSGSSTLGDGSIFSDVSLIQLLQWNHLICQI